MGVDRRGGNGLLRRRIRKTGAVITAVLLFFATPVFCFSIPALANEYTDPVIYEKEGICNGKELNGMHHGYRKVEYVNEYKNYKGAEFELIGGTFAKVKGDSAPYLYVSPGETDYVVLYREKKY